MNSQNLDQVRQEFDPFFAGLAFYDRVWRAAKQKLDVCLASDFNVFNYIQPNENTISGIIADLLNPRGSHGQGVIFLQKFLELLKDEVPSKSKQELQNAVERLGIEEELDFAVEEELGDLLQRRKRAAQQAQARSL